PAATTTARAVTTRATRVTTSTTPPRARSLKGLSVSSGWGSRGPGTTGKARGGAAVMTAHQRQRADGSDPVGVNNRTKLSRASAAAPVAGEYRATAAAAGAGPGRAPCPQGAE